VDIKTGHGTKFDTGRAPSQIFANFIVSISCLFIHSSTTKSLKNLERTSKDVKRSIRSLQRKTDQVKELVPKINQVTEYGSKNDQLLFLYIAVDRLLQ